MKAKTSSPLNGIWLFMIVFATIMAAYNGNGDNGNGYEVRMEELTTTIFDSAENAIDLAIGLIGALAFWLGIMKVVEVAGLLDLIARALRPIMVRLFPEVPPDHPAMSAMIMNMAANALGLGNAATPLGLKAMAELNKLNAVPGTATNAMCLFLAINTSSLTLLPINTMSVRASAGASNPAAIVFPSILATACSTAIAIIMAKLLARPNPTPEQTEPEEPATAQPESDGMPDEQPTEENSNLQQREPPNIIGKLLFGLLALGFVYIVIRGIRDFVISNGISALFSTDAMNTISNWLLPVLICTLLLFAYFRGVKIYEVLVEGAKEGFQIAVRIMPFLVAIFVAIGMFRESGALDLLTNQLSDITEKIGFPAEALPMALIRPLSGSGAFGIMSELVNNAPNSFLAFFVSTMQGSTETTFYVMAVYFGSIGIYRTRHTLPAALTADLTGVIAAFVICKALF